MGRHFNVRMNYPEKGEEYFYNVENLDISDDCIQGIEMMHDAEMILLIINAHEGIKSYQVDKCLMIGLEY